jgi:hypothetical protein
MKLKNWIPASAGMSGGWAKAPPPHLQTPSTARRRHPRPCASRLMSSVMDGVQFPRSPRRRGPSAGVPSGNVQLDSRFRGNESSTWQRFPNSLACAPCPSSRQRRSASSWWLAGARSPRRRAMCRWVLGDARDKRKRRRQKPVSPAGSPSFSWSRKTSGRYRRRLCRYWDVAHAPQCLPSSLGLSR